MPVSMAVVRRELLVVSIAFFLALTLLGVTSGIPKPEGWGAFAWGWPVGWHTTEDMMVGGFSLFGFFLGTVLWARFAEDLLFWMTIAVPAVEIVSHSGILRTMRIFRARALHRTSATSP